MSLFLEVKEMGGLHGRGFTLDAPLVKEPSELFGKTFFLRIEEKWLALGPCPEEEESCLLQGSAPLL